MADDLSEALEDSLLSTIDLQLDEIDEELEDSQLETDEDFALAAWRRQLQAWKADTEAESPNISATRITKRAADLDIETPQKKRRGKRATKVKPKPEEADCDICTESFPIKSTVPLSCCGTRYCKSCLESWFHASLESKCVPKCCGNEFEPENFYGFIPQKQQLQRQYDMVKKELDADDKSYCCHPECGAFIGIDAGLTDFVRCNKCKRKTCTTCHKGISEHIGKNRMCKNHLNDEILEETMIENEWKRCPGCKVVIEKNGGCINVHVTEESEAETEHKLADDERIQQGLRPPRSPPASLTACAIQHNACVFRSQAHPFYYDLHSHKGAAPNRAKVCIICRNEIDSHEDTWIHIDTCNNAFHAHCLPCWIEYKQQKQREVDDDQKDDWRPDCPICRAIFMERPVAPAHGAVEFGSAEIETRFDHLPEEIRAEVLRREEDDFDEWPMVIWTDRLHPE
ncbi:hypothetical protein OHC33_009860 [Knufia fluminis]|uniref:RBR-type E3 ubiquitin transferase n=1 Tax=Knufia fluminis TaxID=191047 RepID=A0AAN8E8V0_9EURO|nr:hypothetical protein OHC33_009860 [Knufia fluminis]